MTDTVWSEGAGDPSGRNGSDGADGSTLPPVDIAVLAAGLGVALRSTGLPAGPERCERLARAVTVMRATTIAELHACALATMVSDPSQIGAFERVFAEMFAGSLPAGGRSVVAPQQGMTV